MKPGSFFLAALLSVATVVLPASAFAQSKRTVVTLEISADRRTPLGDQQKWSRMLQSVGADRVTSKTTNLGEASIDEKETSDAIRIRVRGFIANGKLELPGGKFRIRDKEKIRKLIAKFRVDGAEITLSKKAAFGLTERQLVWVHAKLGVTVDKPTKGMKVADVVSKLTQKVGLPVVRDRAARMALASDEVIRDELQGLTAGTSLAAILRPLGLVLEPVRKSGNDIQLHFKDVETSKEHWPIGWPLEIAPVRAAPKLFKQTKMNISNYRLDVALRAIQKQAGVPFLYDHNKMARENIDLAKSKGTINSKKVSFLMAASKLLRQTKPRMSEEIRKDERGTAFLWITSNW